MICNPLKKNVITNICICNYKYVECARNYRKEKLNKPTLAYEKRINFLKIVLKIQQIRSSEIIVRQYLLPTNDNTAVRQIFVGAGTKNGADAAAAAGFWIGLAVRQFRLIS